MIIVLSNSVKGKRLTEILQRQGEEAICVSEHLDPKQISRNKPDLVISYGYARVVKREIVDIMKTKIINMHPSVLPINRGSYANLWSFIYDTPKGVTIHILDEGLDTGDILIQQQVEFDPSSETFQTTYDKLEELQIKLLLDHLQELKMGELSGRKQTGVTSYHSLKKYNLFRDRFSFSWDDNIGKFLHENSEEINKFLEEFDE